MCSIYYSLFVIPASSSVVYVDDEQMTDDALPADDDVDKWQTVAIETVGQKYIAQRRQESIDGVTYSVVPIVRDTTAPRQPPVYTELNSRRFTINVQVVGQKSQITDRRNTGKGGPVKSSGTGNASSSGKPKTHTSTRGCAAGRKAVAAKKPNATLTRAGQRIVARKQQRTDARNHAMVTKVSTHCVIPNCNIL